MRVRFPPPALNCRYKGMPKFIAPIDMSGNIIANCINLEALVKRVEVLEAAEQARQKPKTRRKKKTATESGGN